LPRAMPAVSAVVLGAPPQLVKRSTKAFVGGAFAENSERRLTGEYLAVDEYQIDDVWQGAITQARKDRPERRRPTGATAAAVGNVAVRIAHALALAKGPEAFMADLHGAKVDVDLVVYTEDALYGQGLLTISDLVKVFGSQNEHWPMRHIMPISGGHRIPERYPCVTNDITDALLRS